MDRDDLRIGDAEREQTMTSLREHFAQGRLTHDELDERLDQTLAAKTARDLAAVTADLPGPQVKQPPAFPAGGYDPADWREAMRAHHKQLHQARRDMHRQMHGQWRGHRHRHGPGPLIPLLFAAMIVALVVGAGALFKVLLAAFVVMLVLNLVFRRTFRR
ncbi:MAG: DUF1707 domain-containing protein [Nonomuraea sp.]|nr:DUF1707 domain-containing protein [Nonomuraea sp.]